MARHVYGDNSTVLRQRLQLPAPRLGPQADAVNQYNIWT